MERAERLIHEDDARPRRQRPRDADALTLAARQFMGKAIAVERAVEPHEIEQLVHPRSNLRARRTLQLRRDPDIAGDADMREQSAALKPVAIAAALLYRVDRVPVIPVDHDVTLDGSYLHA